MQELNESRKYECGDIWHHYTSGPVTLAWWWCVGGLGVQVVMVTPPSPPSSPALVSSLLPLEHSGLSSRNNEEVATQHTSDVTILSPRGSYDTYDAFDGGLPKAKITKKGGSPNTYLDTLERNATFCRHLHHSLSTFSLIILLEYAIFCPNTKLFNCGLKTKGV